MTLGVFRCAVIRYIPGMKPKLKYCCHPSPIEHHIPYQNNSAAGRATFLLHVLDLVMLLLGETMRFNYGSHVSELPDM